MPDSIQLGDLTNKIATVILPDSINGVTQKYDNKEGWLKVSDNAAELCSWFSDNKKYAGFPIDVETIKSNNGALQRLKETHKLLKEFANGPNKKIQESSKLKKLKAVYQFLVEHANHKA